MYIRQFIKNKREQKRKKWKRDWERRGASVLSEDNLNCEKQGRNIVERFRVLKKEAFKYAIKTETEQTYNLRAEVL